MNKDGIIVRITPFKESSAMISLLTKDKLLSFLAKGAFRKKNPNILITTPLMYGNFTFVDYETKSLIFKEMNPLINTNIYMNDINKLFAINFINEITIRLFNDEDMPCVYDCLKETIIAIKDNDNVISLILSYLAICLNLTGYGINANNCIRSGSNKDIVGISYSDGGLVSKNYFNKEKDKLYSINKIKIIHYIFNLNIEDISNIKFNKDDAKEILKDLLEYTYNQTGIIFKNIQILDKI